MEITEVRVKLVNGKNDKLRAFCSITIDNDFVIRDLKVIDGAKGPFVAMPSRKAMEKCPQPGCSGKNHFRARYCNDCGKPLPRSSQRDRSEGDLEEGNGRSKFHIEVAHPINSKCRERIQRRVLERYHEEAGAAPDSGDETVSRDERDEAVAAVDDYFDVGADRQPSGASAAVSKPAFDDPGLRRRPAGPRSAGRRDGEAGERRAEQEPGGSRARDEREEREDSDRTSGPTREDEGSAPSRRDAPRYPSRESVADDSEPEDNFGAGIF